jgi:hypothetical protein
MSRDLGIHRWNFVAASPACILPSVEALLSEGQCTHGFVNPVLGTVIYFHENFKEKEETGALII